MVEIHARMSSDECQKGARWTTPNSLNSPGMNGVWKSHVMGENGELNQNIPSSPSECFNTSKVPWFKTFQRGSSFRVGVRIGARVGNRVRARVAKMSHLVQQLLNVLAGR